MNALPIRIGGLNTQLSEVRDFGRANAMRNCEITKCNQVERRKGYIRRLNVQQAGPIRMLHSFKGICGRFYSYSDGGGLVFISGNNYTSPFGFAAALGNSIDLSWSYRDSSGVRDTPPEGCTGIRVYRSYSGYATAFDSGTLVYEGSGTSCVDPSPTITGIVYYTAYTTWSHQERIESPLIVMAWAAYVPAGETSPTPPAIPDVPGSPTNACGPSGGGSGPVTSSGGSTVVGSGINRESDEVSQAAAEAAIDEEEDIDFFTTVDLASVNHVDLTWKFRGDSQYNSGFVTIYRSTTSGTGSTGTLIYRSSVGSMWGETADTSLDEYSSDYYYTFFFFVDGVGVYSYEKFTEKQSRSLDITLPSTVYNGTAFNMTVQIKDWTGASDTSYTPAAALAITQTGATSVSPSEVTTVGWASGAKTVALTMVIATAGTITVSCDGDSMTGSGTMAGSTEVFTDAFARSDRALDGDNGWDDSGSSTYSATWNIHSEKAILENTSELWYEYDVRKLALSGSSFACSGNYAFVSVDQTSDGDWDTFDMYSSTQNLPLNRIYIFESGGSTVVQAAISVDTKSSAVYRWRLYVGGTGFTTQYSDYQNATSVPDGTLTLEIDGTSVVATFGGLTVSATRTGDITGYQFEVFGYFYRNQSVRSKTITFPIDNVLLRG